MIPGPEQSLNLSEIRVRARGWSEVYRLPFRNRVWRGQAGDAQGAGVGSSLDFQDHRSYVPGDDPRHINWQAYARTGQYTMKLFREEVRPMVDLLFDVSESMFYIPEKAQRAVELFYLVVEASWRSGAALRTHLIWGDRCRSLTDDLLLGDAWLGEREGLRPEDPAAAPRLSRAPLRANALRVFVSDLLYAGSPDPLMAAFAARRGRPVVLAPWRREEADPDWSGNYEFIDAERGSRHPHRVEPALLRKYRQAYARHFDMWKEFALKHGIPLARVAAQGGFREALEAEAARIGAVERWM
ncbi:MAG TPA: DUF58 domain-containing protein [Verrucomicrobiales bacterium]|nr:DUF58 domain-containing protein [Verrucomicrobiales bacterium]